MQLRAGLNEGIYYDGVVSLYFYISLYGQRVVNVFYVCAHYLKWRCLHQAWLLLLARPINRQDVVFDE